MVGVWMLPVMAQEMMTLSATVVSLSYPEDICLETAFRISLKMRVASF